MDFRFQRLYKTLHCSLGLILRNCISNYTYRRLSHNSRQTSTFVIETSSHINSDRVRSIIKNNFSPTSSNYSPLTYPIRAPPLISDLSQWKTTHLNPIRVHRVDGGLVLAVDGLVLPCRSIARYGLRLGKVLEVVEHLVINNYNNYEVITKTSIPSHMMFHPSGHLNLYEKKLWRIIGAPLSEFMQDSKAYNLLPKACLNLTSKAHQTTCNIRVST